ncbi:MAG: hypothetical protein IT326_02675 [Anaerolineae bacterium]|nr:hypothetical protein [Anaerolineae bacterium]
MGIIGVLQIIAALATILTGLYALARPRAVVDFIGLEPKGGRGITEIRSIFGAAFIALGAAPLVLGEATYTMLGVMYLAIALVRLPSIFLDRSSVQSNWISVASEVVLGVILLL